MSSLANFSHSTALFVHSCSFVIFKSTRTCSIEYLYFAKGGRQKHSSNIFRIRNLRLFLRLFSLDQTSCLWTLSLDKNRRVTSRPFSPGIRGPSVSALAPRGRDITPPNSITGSAATGVRQLLMDNWAQVQNDREEEKAAASVFAGRGGGSGAGKCCRRLRLVGHLWP